MSLSCWILHDHLVRSNVHARWYIEGGRVSSEDWIYIYFYGEAYKSESTEIHSEDDPIFFTGHYVWILFLPPGVIDKYLQ